MEQLLDKPLALVGIVIIVLFIIITWMFLFSQENY